MDIDLNQLTPTKEWHITSDTDLPGNNEWVLGRWVHQDGSTSENPAYYHSDRGWMNRYDKLTERPPDAWCRFETPPFFGGYRHTPEMGEISGFGGGYEQTCQNMLHAGVEWLSAHKEAVIKLKTYENIYGVATLVGEDNEPDAVTQELEDVLMKACENDCTGAMHQAVCTRLAYIHANGWDQYVKRLTREEIEPQEQQEPKT